MVRLAQHEVVINAPATEVYRQLTTVDGLLRWIAVDAVFGACAGWEVAMDP